ncbi:enzyme E2 2 [Seminavis robusta]|uniref:Enzyme E2 2 n=1 Tax=Seminavis robusta TaxID=568900 RepID=A0A9N8H574_9STRA|nr:enzyme E2 2 [Seminavis robusta]|eukprot:Sro135_g063720.1 enzyme E2 2 (699) ;mRNA; f:32992-35088
MNTSILVLPNPRKQHAIRRLHKDWRELKQEKDTLPTISAAPTSSIFEWHCNLRPDHGPYASTIIHLILQFTEDYPHKPPRVKLCSWMNHPNVFSGGYICLDMIQPWGQRYPQPYTGWTSAYSVLSLLLQLQSFLFAENIPQIYGTAKGLLGGRRSKGKIGDAIHRAQQFTCAVYTHDGTRRIHTHSNPWPPLPTATGMVPQPSLLSRRDTQRANKPLPFLPREIFTKIFSFLNIRGLVQARDACAEWGRIVHSFNLFERSQVMCFHTKATVDDPDTILGIGLSVEYYPDGKTLKMATSPLDVLSLHAFQKENIRGDVWGTRRFGFFLPLVLNPDHSARAVDRMEKTMYSIMKNSVLHSYDSNRRQPPPPRLRYDQKAHAAFHPLMAFQLLAIMMNSMVVQLMNAAEEGGEVTRYASEKALEGYCAFHHILLFFAKRYPVLEQHAEKQVSRFLSAYYFRHKLQEPNLGLLLICLTLSKTGWNSLRKPLVMEAFDRNVRWLLRSYPLLAEDSISAEDRLQWTFQGAKTSLRLLMFQAYFMSRIGRPSNKRGPMEVLDQYERQMGKPTPKQKKDLQRNAKEILAVTTWSRFFQRLGGPIPSDARLADILKQAVANSLRKRYHDPNEEANRVLKERIREERWQAGADEREQREAERLQEFWETRERTQRERREAEREHMAQEELERGQGTLQGFAGRPRRTS